MISVCIPIYNQNLVSLVAGLETQLQELNPPAEIILIDDASDTTFQLQNRPLGKKHTYVELPENVGRARIRNLFLEHARHDYLLFLDGDAALLGNNLLSNYRDALQHFTPVVCGGSIYPTQKPPRNQRLRWKNGHFRESKPAFERNQHPNQSFMTNNFLIHRSIFEIIRFDERLTQYGHEDTLFGFELKQQGIRVLHIENPVLNPDIDTNKIFLYKTEQGIKNLIRIVREFNYPDQLKEEISLLRVAGLLEKRSSFFLILHRISKGFFRLWLKSGYAPLFIFNLYKLGYYLEKNQLKLS